MTGHEFGMPAAMPVGGAIALALGIIAYGAFVPGSGMFGPVITHGPRDGFGRVALTFDDGPTPEGTGPILEVLEAAGARATFFFIGSNVARNPELVRRAAAAGHQIENHSFDHSWWGVMRRGWYWKEQLTKTDAAIRAAGGRAKTRYFRPPMGFKTWRMTLAARDEGHKLVAWSLRGLDGVACKSESILNRILPRARGGDIIALHDGGEPGARRDPGATIAAVPALVRGLREKGLEPVTLNELLSPAGLGEGQERPGE
jgi:peptidoglycan/xylan/chitin deacetylase (PgdA/CDA1 family)